MFLLVSLSFSVRRCKIFCCPFSSFFVLFVFLLPLPFSRFCCFFLPFKRFFRSEFFSFRFGGWSVFTIPGHGLFVSIASGNNGNYGTDMFRDKAKLYPGGSRDEG